MAYTDQKTLLGSASSGTSPDTFVGDARLISLSVETQVAGASNITISLSNADGFQAAIPATSYSVVTLLPRAGIYSLDPGTRWLKAERASGSTSTVLINKYLQA